MTGIVALRVQVPNNHILTQNQDHNYYHPKPKYLILGYMDPLGWNFKPRPLNATWEVLLGFGFRVQVLSSLQLSTSRTQKVHT